MQGDVAVASSLPGAWCGMGGEGVAACGEGWLVWVVMGGSLGGALDFWVATGGWEVREVGRAGEWNVVWEFGR